MKLNEKIYEYRKLKNWSQEELSYRLNVSRQTISKWEVGKAVPELDKLIKLAELFDITVDELVKEDVGVIYKNNIDKLLENQNEEIISNNETEKNDQNNLRKINSNKRMFKIKKERLKKVIMIALILIMIAIVYRVISNKVTLLKREKDIKEIAQVYNDNFKTIEWSESAYISEVVSTRENNIIKETYRVYYVYAEDEKRLIKAKEYEDRYHKKLIKEIYIDLSKQVSSDFITNICKYDDVTEIYIDDWSYKVIDDYEFITPMDRITRALEDRYFDLVGNSEKIALDKNNTIFALKFPKHNVRTYGWSYGIKNNPEREDVLDLYIANNENFLSFYFDNYKNDILDSREIIEIKVTKQKGCIDDVTVPEL